MQAAVEGEDQRHRVFGHGVRRVGRDPHDGQAETLGGGQVHMVVTRRAQGDQPGAAIGQALQHRRREVVVDEGADHVEAVGQGRGVEGQPRLLEVQLEGGAGTEEAFAVIGLAAEQNGAHGVSFRCSAA
ncbi:hypothetical protein D3C85_1419420 [compost metagenome]